ncbi:MAG: hypothetical protein ACFFCW_49385 [Candidatus Hodarchaeota archaeon]
MSRRDEIEKLITELNRRLQKLKQQQARKGIDTPPQVEIEIEDLEKELEQLQMELEAVPETTQPISDLGLVATNYVQFILNEFDKARINDLINTIVKELDIQRQSIRIVSSSNSQVVVEMPAESAMELVEMFTTKSKQISELAFRFSVIDIKELTDKDREDYHLREARKFITERCLIAADVDKTLIDQREEREVERRAFRKKIAPNLIEAARMGTHIAAITGNSMQQLSSRFFRWIVGELWNDRDITPLANFHLFCNSGGIYVNFDRNDETFKSIVQKVRSQEIDKDEVIEQLTLTEEDGNISSIHPRFIDTTYIKRTAIPEQDIQELVRILEEAVEEFQYELIQNVKEYRKDYLINTPNSEERQQEIRDQDSGILYELFDKTGKPIMPKVDTRPVRYGKDDPYKNTTVQITVRPVLSFRHAKKPVDFFGKDFRSKLTKAIQSKLDHNGFTQYVARPGGRTSIDVTLEKVDKAYAIEFLIDHLNLQGSSRLGMEFGSNAIYFGDEVIVGDGNDYSVTRIPGLLVFAVNKDRDLIPSLSRVFIPSTIFDGPAAVAKELAKFTSESERLLKEYCQAKDAGETPITKTAIEALKEKIFVERIKDKINHWDISPRNIPPKDLELMHILVTLMCRDDPIAHQWLSILVDELNAIMTYLEESSKKDVSTVIKAIGYSYEI